MPLPFILGTNAVTGGYEVANSLRFNEGSSDSLEYNQSTPTNGKIFTISVWTKFIEQPSANAQEIIAGGTGGSDETFLRYNNQEKIQFRHDHSSDTNWHVQTNRVLRDPSAWYHIVAAVDTTQGTASNRVKIYVNGVEETSFATSNYPAQNEETFLNKNSGTVKIGQQAYANSGWFSGYMCEFVFVDGQQLDATSFGEFDAASPTIWKPIDVSGLTFGTNGFYLNVPGVSTGQNANGLGGDSSGNGNHFASSGFSAVDQSTDTCTNNFCTLNPLSKGTITLSEGNLQWQGSGDNGGKGTFLMTAGKWYWEMKRGDSEDNVGFGVAVSNWTNAVDAASGEAWYGYQGQAYKVSGSGEVSYGATFTNNDIVSCLFNADDGILAFYKNGASQGNAYTGLTNSDGYVPIYFTYRSSVTNYMNFGSPMHSISSGNSDANGYGNFEYAVPSGYFALCSKNLAEYG
jgi:hypothetical protein